MQQPTGDKPDISEKGAQGLRSDHRLFMQLLAFGDCGDTSPLAAALAEANCPGVLYEDLNDPYGVAVLTFSDDPSFFVDTLRPLLHRPPFCDLTPKPRYTTLGRTYTIGYETDLDEVLIDRPRRRVLDATWPWAVWYPLRRSGEFAQLPHEKQREILGEHGRIGIAFGKAGYAHDIRLACHGLDVNDNDFVIGLLGRDLHPLSALVQTMRSTQQTSRYLTHLGPFFVGRAVWRMAGQ